MMSSLYQTAAHIDYGVDRPQSYIAFVPLLSTIACKIRANHLDELRQWKGGWRLQRAKIHKDVVIEQKIDSFSHYFLIAAAIKTVAILVFKPMALIALPLLATVCYEVLRPMFINRAVVVVHQDDLS